MRPSVNPSDAVAITKSDSTILDLVGLYVGGTGDVALMGEGGVAVTLSAVPVGTIIPMHIVKVMSTNTTATLLVGFKP